MVASARLVGGLTADMFRLSTESGSAAVGPTVVLRCWPTEAAWGPAHVVREAAGLTAIADAGLPVPRMLAYDAAGDDAGTPATLTTFVSGRVELTQTDPDGWLRGLAQLLARIHDLPVLDLPACEGVLRRRGARPGLAR